ncbi:hypothetical protein BDV29DRAFT_159436 [Aspergillus leporis]|uniref:Uncharacterized protein n=1 Tax=Aspergillus leporis TaxID=41062 RepID=A0A5N5WSJ6_9EURO|nr:hypothetical protein BDV29DRAFT_159436 [Aspergillus leporis]
MRTSYFDSPRYMQALASEVVTIILTADSSYTIKKRVEEAVSAESWTESLAEAILRGLENAIAAGAQMAEASSNAVSRARTEAFEFAQDHPIFVTILALGVLVILTPWVIEILGFGELGPIEGSFAAAWQRTYAGYVPKRSLFSYLQRLRSALNH